MAGDQRLRWILHEAPGSFPDLWYSVRKTAFRRRGGLIGEKWGNGKGLGIARLGDWGQFRIQTQSMVEDMRPSVLLATLTLAFSAAAPAAFAADAPTLPTARQLQLAHRYIELIHIDKSYADTMKSLAPSILASMPKGKGDDPAMQQKVFEAASEAASEMMVTLVKKMEPIMAETYSEEELADLVAFYESQTGKALIEKQPLLLGKIGPMMMEIMPQFQTSLRTKVCARVDCKALESH